MVPPKPSYEKIGTLDELDADFDASGLPGTNHPSKPIIERTRLMQHEGQGYYKEPTNGEGWSRECLGKCRFVTSARGGITPAADGDVHD